MDETSAKAYMEQKFPALHVKKLVDYGNWFVCAMVPKNLLEEVDVTDGLLALNKETKEVTAFNPMLHGNKAGDSYSDKVERGKGAIAHALRMK